MELKTNVGSKNYTGDELDRHGVCLYYFTKLLLISNREAGVLHFKMIFLFLLIKYIYYRSSFIAAG